MCLTDSIIIINLFFEKYKRMHRLYGIGFPFITRPFVIGKPTIVTFKDNDSLCAI